MIINKDWWIGQDRHTSMDIKRLVLFLLVVVEKVLLLLKFQELQHLEGIESYSLSTGES